jgi:hypothetical protein
MGLTTPHHKKNCCYGTSRRRPRPDMGCRAIGWMDDSSMPDAQCVLLLFFRIKFHDYSKITIAFTYKISGLQRQTYHI